MLNKYLNKLERKCGRFAIPNLMLYIVTGMGIVFIFNMVLMTNPDNQIDLLGMIDFDLDKIKSGEVWRVISFVFMPPESSIIFIVFALYFYWLMGTAMERLWGEFKFNVFYFTGIIFCIIAGFVTGFSTNVYLNLSLFLAFAVLFPNEELHLFFMIPIKVKWLGLLDLALLVYSFVTGGMYARIFLLLSMANLLLFFGKDAVTMIYYTFRKMYYKFFKKM